MESHHFEWVNPLYMAIFNSYVELLEGMVARDHQTWGGCDGSPMGCHESQFSRPSDLNEERRMEEVPWCWLWWGTPQAMV